MIKLKSLLPTLKEKKRYLAFEIISKEKIKDFSSVANAIYDSTQYFAGVHGMARMGLKVFPEHYNEKKQTGLIRVTNKELEELKASLTLIKQIENNPVIVKSIGVSGILTKAKNKYTAG